MIVQLKTVKEDAKRKIVTIEVLLMEDEEKEILKAGSVVRMILKKLTVDEIAELVTKHPEALLDALHAASKSRR